MTNEFGRRTILAAPALLAFASGTAACAQTSGTSQRARSNTLVAYFSRSGNTRVIAGTLQRALEADLFEIEPLRPYPEDYEQTVEQARQERDRGYEPPLKARAPGVAAYDTVSSVSPSGARLPRPSSGHSCRLTTSPERPSGPSSPMGDTGWAIA